MKQLCAECAGEAASRLLLLYSKPRFEEKQGEAGGLAPLSDLAETHRTS